MAPVLRTVLRMPRSLWREQSGARVSSAGGDICERCESAWGLQPYALEAATVCARGCNPDVVEAPARAARARRAATAVARPPGRGPIGVEDTPDMAGQRGRAADWPRLAEAGRGGDQLEAN